MSTDESFVTMPVDPKYLQNWLNPDFVASSASAFVGTFDGGMGGWGGGDEWKWEALQLQKWRGAQQDNPKDFGPYEIWCQKYYGLMSEARKFIWPRFELQAELEEYSASLPTDPVAKLGQTRRRLVKVSMARRMINENFPKALQELIRIVDGP